MGGQCCNGTSPGEGKETITTLIGKDPISGIGVKHTPNDNKQREEEALMHVKDKYQGGKSIVSHNSKQDYQEVKEKSIGSISNNQVLEEQQHSEKVQVERQGSHLQSSYREIPNSSDLQKQIVKTGSGIKIPSALGSVSSASKQTAPGENNHLPEVANGRSNSKESGKEQMQAQPNQNNVQKQYSSGGQSQKQEQKPQEARGKKISIQSSEKPQSVPVKMASPEAKTPNKGIPPLSQPDQTHKKDSTPIQQNKSVEDGKKSKNSSIPRPPQEKKQKETGISKEDLIILKKGSITQYYKIGEILGEGAFGQVSKIIHHSTKMVRAMKTIKKSSIIKEEEQKLFSEMNILKKLDHPNILRLIELFEDNKNYYLVTEYCSGGELFDKIKSMTHFTEKMAADYMNQILSAVVYCHQNNIVHRDLKPENLLFDSSNKDANLKVIDFGTSRKMDKTKKMSKRLGTPYYIAPEVLDQNYDEKCDVWSCGVILFILLCGYPPFGGRSEDEILKKVRQGKFTFEPEDWGRISEEAKSLIKKMLTYDPKKRISAETALTDPWIQKNAPSNHISTRALSNLSSFYTRSKLKQAILTFIVSQVVSQQDRDELQRTFRSLDRNGDGTLSKEELIEGYTTIMGDKEKAAIQVDKILEEVDFNKSGKVDFTEFLMAALNKETLLSKEKIHQSFKIFDQDGNGNITKDELSYIMGDIPDDFWKEILEECDTNKDGMISQAEFIDFLMTKNILL